MDLLLRGVFIALGLAHQAASHLAPFRTQRARREVKWDTIAMIAGAVFGFMYVLLIGGPLSRWLLEQPVVASWNAAVSRWPWVWTLVLNVVVSDLFVYGSHRFLHGRLLWHSHAWHHSAKHVWWLSGLRASPVHALLTMLPYTAGHLLFPLGDASQVLLGVVIFRMANQHWLHSNLQIPCAHALEKVFVTPRFHFVHHSSDVRYTNTNYSFVFTWWDRLFGTFVDPETMDAEEPLGLDYDNSYPRLLFGLPPAATKPQGSREISPAE